ncbi:secretin N-terminal domain-containing protein [Blastopirellula marina]|uniref:General secretion pathway protein n=1 Tax=Blastopirellula marina TaxID=124 RepID=A0A2S8GBR1_9BACT|nr:secretin N-terminal domain-containing protein [Blastopirellula marina]PQO41877.1 general secretion pathway protein [Blastopirellula marina]PTL46235.1 general secretion pathway protein [Blastopirellula marina]
MQRASFVVRNPRRISPHLFAWCLILTGVSSAAHAQQQEGPVAPPVAAEPLSEEAGEEKSSSVASPAPVNDRLRFSFSGASWRDVFEWIAEAGDLSLYVDDVPTGSFSYADSDYFTVNQAITRLNLFLLPRGFTLVRRGQLLSVINLGDPRGLQQLDAMSTVVTLDQLKGIDDHEVVKCFIPLGELVPTEVINEFQPLSLITTPVVLPKSNQLIITDSAKNLRNALKVLEVMQQPEEDDAVVKRFDLKHVDAETVLMVAGTHLGIPAGDTNGLDITITTDISGKRMFAVGSAEKLDRLESLLKVVDVPDESKAAEKAKTLISHHVTGDNLQIVFDVLQTMLADKSLRLTIQPESNSIVALADAEVHQLIRDTIEELQAPSVEFAVVELKSVDPYFAVSLIGEMFELPTAEDIRRKSKDEEPRVKPPKVDADPGERRLFVRGTAEQIKQIEDLIARLDARGQAKNPSDLRFVPLAGPQRENLLQTAKQHWQGDNCLQILPPADAAQTPVIERTVFPELSDTDQNGTEASPEVSPTMDEQQPADRRPSLKDRDDFVSVSAGYGDGISRTTTTEKAMAPIRSQVVPNGILIQSEDTDALDRFEEHLRTITSQDKKTISPTIVYYLKYVTAEEAVKMLADLLDGGNALADPASDTLINGSSNYSGSSGYFGSFLFERDGVTTVTAGTATVVSDARLNRLIVQGTKEDIAMIESYMKIIDKDSSITAIETSGRSHIIELKHARAEEVAEVIREAYPTRIDTTNQRAAQQANQPQRPDDRRGSGDQRSVDDKPTRGSEPKMAVAVHESSNSLVITAPDSLFAEVEKLVETVDRRSERSVRVISATSGINKETITQILAEQSGQSSSSRDRRDPRSYSRGR